MKVSQLIDLLQKCYEYSDVFVEVDDYTERKISGVDYDDVVGKVYITLEEDK